jgi:predicted RNA binding protein YcfA (HicA-like mRNA interferase family)
MSKPKTKHDWLATLDDRSRLRSWKYRDLKRALESVDAQEVSSEGSHRTWKHADYRDLLTLVKRGNKTLPTGYVKAVRELLRTVIAAEENREDDEDN